MQHLEGLYSGEWRKPPTVEYLLKVQEQTSKHQGEWNYTIFVNFPKRHGFGIQDNYRLYDSGVFEEGCCRMEIHEFQQEWLFFQLISCVVRKANTPILARKDLVRHGRQLNTGNLNQALTTWHNYLVECHRADPETNIMRLLEANQILELAKQVVIANLASHATQPDNPFSEEGPKTPNEKDDQALCYMVLGETLSTVLAHAMKTCNVKLPGWEPDDEGGWGPPAHVYKTMKNEGWCPRSQATIKGQLGRNATLLYVTVCAHEKDKHNIHGPCSPPEKCSPQKCGFIEAERIRPNGNREYELSHSPNCSAGRACRVVGPKEKDILDILDKSEDQGKGTFPLMRIVEREGKREIEVEQWTEETPFATISHVWSQGLGNRTARKIHSCQLEMIENWVKTAFGDQDATGHLFWIDTFAIPQNRGNDPRRAMLKRRAISLIHHIFHNAEHCIIIDRHILERSKTFYDCRSIGAMLLVCGWMMRLWTLQEAFVSAKLHLAMKDRLRSFNDLWKDTGEADVVLLSMTGMVQRKVDHNLMVQYKTDYDPAEFKQQVQQQSRSQDRRHIHGALLIASAWRATRYRTTRNLREETLALATLLGVPISQNLHESGSRAPNGLPAANGLPATNGSSRPEATQEELEELMRNFWEGICKHANFRNSIPPGMIFLPGKRLPFPGFGWAPLTWMSGRDEAYPYPLDNPEHATTLREGRGLLVKYPGFILYPTRDKLKEIINGRHPFEFSVNRGLDEWYKVRATSQKTDDDAQWIREDLRNRVEENEAMKLAIILSRPRPVGVTGEIGLLVKLCQGDLRSSGSQPCPREQQLLYCKIIRRVEVSRHSVSRAESCSCEHGEHTTRGYGLIINRFNEFKKAGIAGMQLSDLQEWCADGYPHVRRPKSSVPSSKPEDTASAPEQRHVRRRRIKRAVKWATKWFPI